MTSLHSASTASNAIPSDIEALLSTHLPLWSERDLHMHSCRDCQPNSPAVYRLKIAKDFRNLHMEFVKYAYSLMIDRGWTFTAATETATMRQAAAKRAATEESDLIQERIAEEIATARRQSATDTTRLVGEEATGVEALMDLDLDLDVDLGDWDQENWDQADWARNEAYDAWNA